MSRPARASHGEYGYARKHKCRCDPCLRSVSRYSKNRRIERARGIEGQVDGDVIRAHIEDLNYMGVQNIQISHASGVGETVIRRIMQADAPSAYVLRPTAAKILAVTYEQAITQNAFVSNIGVRRRIEGLEYLGHPKSRIAEQLGYSESQVHLYLKRDRCYQTTIAPIHDAYVVLRRVEGSSEYTRWRAYRRGYVSPMCWDDETIDDPTARPVGAVCVVRNCSRQVQQQNLCKAHAWEVRNRGGFKDSRRFKHLVHSLGGDIRDRARLLLELAELKEMGFTQEGAAIRLGRAPSYIEKIWGTV